MEGGNDMGEPDESCEDMYKNVDVSERDMKCECVGTATIMT